MDSKDKWDLAFKRRTKIYFKRSEIDNKRRKQKVDKWFRKRALLGLT